MLSTSEATWPESWLRKALAAAVKAVRYRYRDCTNVENLADDATMEAMLEAVKKGRCYFNEENDGLHLIRFCRKRAIQRAGTFLSSRKNKRSRGQKSLTTFHDGNDDQTIPTSSENPEDKAIQKEDTEQIRQCLARLNAQEQEVLWLKYHDGETDVSIAGIFYGRTASDADRQAVRRKHIAAKKRFIERRELS